MTILKIKQLDTWVFKTQRPFSFSEDTFSEIIFPPTPSTIYGAIRSMILFNRNGGIKKIIEEGYEDIGNVRKYGSFEIKYIIIGDYIDKYKYFSIPNDILIDDENSHENLSLSREKYGVFDDKYSLDNILINKDIKEGKESFEKGYIDKITLDDYLANGYILDDEIMYTKEKDIKLDEHKVGIGRNFVTHAAKEGLLYRLPHIRFNNKLREKEYYLEIGIEGLEIGEKNMIMKLGGESKAGLVKINKDTSFPQFNYSDEEVEYIKLYLITPAIFEKGWLPDILDDDYNIEIEGIKMKLISVSMKKPFWISGWDLYRKAPKPAYKAIPAGSVYYFKLGNKMKIKDIANKLNYSSLCKEPFSKEGYGRVLVGKVKI